MIRQNKIQCNNCGDIIESVHVHDFKWCSCGNCAVDGGREYLKRNGINYKDLSTVDIELEKLTQLYKLLNMSLEAFNNIQNQKVLISEGYAVTDTYQIAAAINKFLKDETNT